MIRFRFVHDTMTELPVKRMCELAEVPRSSFYAWLTRVPSARELADAGLLELIGDIYVECDCQKVRHWQRESGRFVWLGPDRTWFGR